METEISEDEILRVQERLERADLDTLLFLVTEITGEEYSKDYERLFYGYSVSDIVEVGGENYYCDAMGWVKLK